MSGICISWCGTAQAVADCAPSLSRHTWLCPGVDGMRAVQVYKDDMTYYCLCKQNTLCKRSAKQWCDHQGD
eukprot:CAMPEP_0202912350 /NCGR_PEP_ID=MMETSP1392-20130828/57516_1 /ASSEMBLY_ACC=CAM_ASM_000868 /TAXON_ID=225041 /ORGANISM="Chlamydomonas chlamydogama, Strain SAG 11-48b" /LENGTH=70 /DNA_ID=CAMNT_0049603219 /DNA_START=1 /DNA_END=213 /DNA_ORIENTATION=+